MGNDIHLYHDLQLQTFLIPRLHFLTKGNNCIIAETTICVKPCTEYTTGSSSTFLTILFYSLLFQCSLMGKLKYKNQKETKIYIISTLEIFFKWKRKLCFILLLSRPSKIKFIYLKWFFSHNSLQHFVSWSISVYMHRILCS